MPDTTKNDSDNVQRNAIRAGIGATALQTGSGLELNRQLKPLSDANKQLYEKVIQSADPETVIHHAPFLDNAYYDPSDHSVVVGERFKTPSILAHELGHGELAKHRFGKLLQNKPTMIAGSLGRNAALASLVGAATAQSDNPYVQTAGRWAPAALSAPLVAFEGLASILAHRRLKRLGATKQQLSEARRTLLAAWGTYVGGAGLSTAGAHLGSGLSSKMKEEDAPIKRTLLGNPISAALDAKKGKRIEAYTDALGHQWGQEGLGALKGLAGGAALGGAYGALTGNFPAGLIQGAAAGGSAGRMYGGYKGHMDEKATEIYRRHKQKEAMVYNEGVKTALSKLNLR